MSVHPPFEFVDDVTSDLSFVAHGATLGEVFEAAAAAFLAATLDQPETLRETERRRLELTEPDRELLLLAFLNELVYLRDAERLLLRPHRLEVEEAAGQARLRGELAGEAIDRSRHALVSDVKAATAHGLRLTGEPGNYRATVTLDV
jgi:SHS2 domain-containing protein